MIDWSDVDTVMLDMDGTLLDLHFDNYFWQECVPEAYASIHGLTPAESKAVVYPRLEAERGNLNWYCLDHWSRELGLDIAALKREIRHLLAIRGDADRFLVALADSDKQVALVTNAHPDALSLKLEVTRIARWFGRIISSHAYGYPKEHPQFWERLRADFPFDPARTLFVDAIAKEIGCLMPVSKLMFRPRLLVRHWFYPFNQACYRLTGPHADPEMATREMMRDAIGPLTMTVATLFLLPLQFLPRSVHPKYILLRAPPSARGRPPHANSKLEVQWPRT